MTSGQRVGQLRSGLTATGLALGLCSALTLAGCNKPAETPAPGAPGGNAAKGAAGAPGAPEGGGGRGGRGGGGAPVGVTTVNVQKMAVQRMVDLAGTLNSPDQAKVAAESGGRIEKTFVEIGSEVKVGDPLVKLDPTELNFALARAESALRQTRAQLGMSGPLTDGDKLPNDDDIGSVKNALANLNDAKATVERSRVLFERKLISPVDLQTSETRYQVAAAAYQSAADQARGTKALLQDRRAAYDLAIKKVSDATVKAPISGVVADRPVMVGEYINERATVATIVQVNPLKLRTGVQEKHAGIVHAGQPVEFRVESFGDVVFKGKVAFVSPSLDQTMRTFTIEAVVDNSDRRLKPGFFAKGTILTKIDEGVLAVPDSAVSTLAGVSSVYIIKDNKVTQTQVTLGVRQGNLWEITDGLTGTETLASSRLNELATGTRVGPPEAGGEGGGRRGGGRGGRGGQGGTKAGGDKGGDASKDAAPAPDSKAGGDSKDSKAGGNKDGKDGKGGGRGRGRGGQQ